MTTIYKVLLQLVTGNKRLDLMMIFFPLFLRHILIILLRLIHIIRCKGAYQSKDSRHYLDYHSLVVMLFLSSIPVFYLKGHFDKIKESCYVTHRHRLAILITGTTATFFLSCVFCICKTKI